MNVRRCAAQERTGRGSERRNAVVALAKEVIKRSMTVWRVGTNQGFCLKDLNFSEKAGDP